MRTIEREILEIEGVVNVQGDENTRRVTVEWEEPPADWEAIRQMLQEINYPPVE